MSDRANTDEPRHGLFIPNFGPLADPALLVEFAVAAEDAGWDGLFLADHLIDFAARSPDAHRSIADPWITLAGIASRTERIRLGSYVTPIARRQPWQLARNVAVLDQLSDGRVILGAGLGSRPDYTRFGRAYDQRTLADRYDEALDVIAGLWRGEPFSYDGTHFTVDDAVLRPRPVQSPRVPIVIGGWWPYKAPFHRGARWDGVMPQWPSMLKHFDEVVVDHLGDDIQRAIDEQHSHETEVRAMLEYYHDLDGEPGEIMLRVDIPNTPPNFAESVRGLGVTWLLSTPVDPAAGPAVNIERLREGPPDL